MKTSIYYLVALLAAFAGQAATPQDAWGDEIFFGTQPVPAGCTQAAGDEGFVCPNNLTFDGGTAGTFTVSGFLGNPNTSAASFLTYKPTPPNALDETGVGQNDLGPPARCNTVDCEIGGGASVAVTSSAPLSQADVVVSSVQNFESFNVWAGEAIGALTEIATELNATNCVLFPGQTDVCVVNLATPSSIIAVESNNALVEAADVLLAAVSTAPIATPEPGSMALLGGALLGLGWVLHRRRSLR